MLLLYFLLLLYLLYLLLLMYHTHHQLFFLLSCCATIVRYFTCAFQNFSFIFYKWKICVIWFNPHFISSISSNTCSLPFLFFSIFLFSPSSSSLFFSLWRVKSCLRLIAAQLHAQAVRGVGIVEADTFSTSISTSSLDMDGNIQSMKRTARRERRLHMLSCNDILSPPLWVLPLVHSPQYLAHLWDLAEEAREVPLTLPHRLFLCLYLYLCLFLHLLLGLLINLTVLR